jgi:hypothetical protein
MTKLMSILIYHTSIAKVYIYILMYLLIKGLHHVWLRQPISTAHVLSTNPYLRHEGRYLLFTEYHYIILYFSGVFTYFYEFFTRHLVKSLYIILYSLGLFSIFCVNLIINTSRATIKLFLKCKLLEYNFKYLR